MFKDRQKALEALEAELLKEEEEEEQLPEEEEPLYRNFSNNYGNAYNRDVEEEDLEDYVREVQNAGSSGRTKGLVALLLILVAGIFLMLAFLLMRYR